MAAQYFIFMCLFLGAANSRAENCPLPPSAIDPSISTNVSFDKGKSLYTYSYTVSNGKASPLPIQYIRMPVTTEPEQIKSPSYWSGRFYDIPSSPSNVSWAARPLPSDIPKIPDDQPSPDLTTLGSAIKPGKSLSGFSFQSPYPPVITQWIAQGFTQAPVVSPTADDDEPASNCPGWDEENSYFKSEVNGIALSPKNGNFHSVRIRLRNEDGKTKRKPFDPKVNDGRVSVLVLASKNFDPAKIEIDSVKFARAEADPISSRLVPYDARDLQPEEAEPWEHYFKEEAPDKAAKRQNLLLVFDQRSLDIQCALDRVLILEGTMDDSSDFIGAVTTKSVGCDLKRPGVHKKFHERKTAF